MPFAPRMLAARSPVGAPAQAASALLKLVRSEFTFCHARTASASPDGGKAIADQENGPEDVAPNSALGGCFCLPVITVERDKKLLAQPLPECK